MLHFLPWIQLICENLHKLINFNKIKFCTNFFCLTNIQINHPIFLINFINFNIYLSQLLFFSITVLNLYRNYVLYNLLNGYDKENILGI